MKLEDWSFVKGKFNGAEALNFDTSTWSKVKIPHTYSMDAIENIGYYRGEAWYKTSLQLSETIKNDRIFIRFEGVGHDTQVYVNGVSVGKHVGGYSAFCFEITDAINKNGENTIAVNVTNEPNYKRIPTNDKLFNFYGGIYRPVQIFSTPKCAIDPTYFASSGVFVETKLVEEKRAQVEVRTHISNTSDSNNIDLKYTLVDSNNEVVFSDEVKQVLNSKNQVVSKVINIENPILWNARKNPSQYTLKIQLENNNQVDIVEQKFGIRTYNFDNDKGFVLNGEPYRLFGVCRHQEWKQFGPALENKQHEKDMDLIDEIGASALRLAHYQQSDKMYEIADEKGILVWAEIPFVHDYTGREGGNAKEQLKELILQNYNHPSIFVWGLWNEVRAWKDPNEFPVGLTKELNKIAHNLDKTRLTTSASDRGITSNMGSITDLQAWNKYFGWYSGDYSDMGKWIDESHKIQPTIKIGISEYGVGANIAHQDRSKLEKPKGNIFPEQIQTEYHETTWKILKERPFVWGTFIWNMFDFSVASWNRGGVRNLNHKGLVTFDREIKKDAFYFYKANWSKEPVLYIAERRNNKRTEDVVNVKVFTNLKGITLKVNGKKIASKKLTSDYKTIVFNNVKLLKGKNTLTVLSNKKHNSLLDEVIWFVE
ncbi:glycoside hydrolase family 2 TIM barrel-domain containing protein [Lutibacter sp. TH_r2]|uniref:glycoside hydrolase family 2 protein n=1 Tax=Lutibacter sp. TH_r2 TaxID=3082083 RepID=UPI002953DC7E|nr:glycoside hydrolase family 2 TIM barrel-domain containing protein [Lutibacter sp. TH_r2]MDV7185881.1 glycoside hydrolase family 2 TIM barrel-domain containing protein [Lutibacter sp. TH_r2]